MPQSATGCNACLESAASRSIPRARTRKPTPPGGTVMGSKNLKAIAVRGTGEVPIHDPKGLLDASYRAVKEFQAKEPTLKLWKEEGATTDLSVTAQWPMTGHELGVNRAPATPPPPPDSAPPEETS